MAIATYHTASVVRTEATPAKRQGLFARIYAGFIEARRRRALEELKRHGVMLPNELELAGWKINERSEDSLPFSR